MLKKYCERWRFTFLELSCEFPQMLYTILCEIITVKLGYHKCYARWVSEMHMGVHKMQRMALALTFLGQYHKFVLNFTVMSYEEHVRNLGFISEC
jgi:hypothetical protein